MIPYGRQDISEEDIAKVEAVLRSDFLTQGPITPKFEDAVAGYCGADHAIAVNSATSALHLACLALDLGPGDWLWTSANTFVASANCGLYCDAKVDFVDIDQRTYNMSVDDLSDKLAKAEKESRLPKVVIPVHFAGQSCDMVAIKTLSNRYGFRIIEDASHAMGASYKNVKVGSCEYSDVTVFSFHPVKIITSAEGGMALTNNKEIADRIRQLRTHGITNDSCFTYEYPEYFKILPQINYWADDAKRIKSGMMLLEGFVCASDSNPVWMSDADLQACIDANVDSIGKF